jgi:hypothetical protein
MSSRWLSLAQSGRIHAQGLKLSKFGSLGPDNSDTFVSSPHQETISVIGTGQRREPSRTTPRPTSSAAVQRPVGRLRPRKGGENRPAAIQLGGGVNFRAGAVAGHSTESTWLDGRQKAHVQWVSYRTRRRKMVQARDPLHDVTASGAGSS